VRPSLLAGALMVPRSMARITGSAGRSANALTCLALMAALPR
jgi:hypothetical protein